MAEVPQSKGPKHTKLDWSLPPSFLTLLTYSATQALDSLLPLPEGGIPPNVPAADHSGTSAKENASSAFLDAMKTTGNTTTDNGAMAHASTGSALVDLFFELAAGVKAERLFEHLSLAWKEDPVSTMRLIVHSRSIHEGKGYREGFFRAIAWVWEHHPRTMLQNLHLIVDPLCKRARDAKRDAEKAEKNTQKQATNDVGVLELDDHGQFAPNNYDLPEYPYRPHGSFDDLTALVLLHLNGQLSTSYTGSFTALKEALAPADLKNSFEAARIRSKAGGQSKRDHSAFKKVGRALRKQSRTQPLVDGAGESRGIQYTLQRAGSQLEKHKLLHARLETALRNDKSFQALYFTVLHLFVDRLRADLEALGKHNDFARVTAEEGKPSPEGSPHLFGMSYAAKWLPTPAHGADKQLHFATAVGVLLFPGAGVEGSRIMLQSKVLSPLRKVLRVPEVQFGQGTWNIDYRRVPAHAMSRYASLFMAKDPTGYGAYLDKVAEGRFIVAGASMFPHELLIDALGSQAVVSRLANLQWRSLINSIASSSRGRLDNCLAVADVSGSMGHLGGSKSAPAPMTVCIALTLLLGELAQAPWNGSFFTFSSMPTCEFIDPALSLSERAKTLRCAHWEQSTALYNVFDLILSTAKREKLSPESMVKKLFVFSDMQFDQASNGQYGETEYQTAKRKFTESGYELPELVFWNLGHGTYGANTSKPARAEEKGVTLISGYSGALMKYFLGAAQDDTDIVAEQELEAKDKAEWVGVEIDDGGRVADLSLGTTARKEKKDAKETMMAIIDAESFRGVVVID